MSLSMAKKLREKRAQLANNARELLDRADKENRGLNTEEQQTFDRTHTEIEELRSQIDRIEKQDELDRQLGESRGVTAGRENAGVVSADEQRAQLEARNAAFTAWVRCGVDGLTNEQRSIMAQARQQASPEQRALSAVTGGSGGYTVAPAFEKTLTEALAAFGGMRSVATVMSTETGVAMPFPTDNDTAQEGAILAENVAAGLQDVAFGSVNIGSFMYTSKIVLVPLQLLQDSAFDINSYLARKLSTRIGRVQNRHFTVGAGGGALPTGAVTAATLGKTGANGQTTSLIVDDLTDLQHAVDPAYRLNAKYMFHDLTLKAIKKLKDGQQRPLWQPGIAVKEPDTINGSPYVINQHMPTMAANAKSILYGDFANYVIRDVMGVTVLRLVERYAEAAQVGFVAFARADGNLVDAGTHPLAYYANSAT